jgi:hypothetical protein
MKRDGPANDSKEVQKHVNVLYVYGMYAVFDEVQCIKIETDYRRGHPSSTIWGRRFPVGQDESLKCMIDFKDMTACSVRVSICVCRGSDARVARIRATLV